MQHLAQGVNTAVGPTRSMNHHRLAFIDTGQGLFNLFLNTSGMGLSLKTSKAITIIGYNRFITCHVFILAGKKAPSKP